MPGKQQQPGSSLVAELRRDRQEEKRGRKTPPREDDAGMVSLRLPQEVKDELVAHVAALQAKGVRASINSLVKVLIVEYLRDVEAGAREPPTITREEIGV
jgi:hypothetical protein